MKQWKSAKEILDFAIQCEEEAVELYTNLAEKSKYAAMTATFKRFALEEKAHKEKLLRIKNEGTLESSTKEIVDLKIGDYLANVDTSVELDYQGALILAMKNEKAAFKLYTHLAAATDDPALKEILLGLAQEEAKHKLHFEIEYDDNILTEN